MASAPEVPSAKSRAKRGRAAAAAASSPPAAVATPTPSRRALSDELSSSRPLLRTSLDRDASRDLLASIRRGTSASGGRQATNKNAPTPHAKAARLALNQRRNALFTPGKNRRRSLMEQRETPMGVLRNLSRALAPKSKPVATSSSPRHQSSSIEPIAEEDDDDELSIDRPRLSLPLDDQDSDLQPPRSSGLEDENHTVQSIELPRRALSEQLGPRLSRGSFGDARISDIFDPRNNDPTLDAGRYSDFFPGFLDELQAGADDFTLNRINMDSARRTTMGRDSDFGLQLPAGFDDQTTFLLSEPPTEQDSGSPVMDRSLVGEAVAEGVPGSLDVSPGQYDAGLAESDDNAPDISLLPGGISKAVELASGARKLQKRVSKHGIEYPPLPQSFVKKVAQTALHSSGLKNPRISADTLAALTQASEWFFEQLGDDLGAYAQHAKRKTVEESDVMTLMRRQRQVGSDATLFSLAQRHLPRELLQDLRMPVPQPTKKRRGKRPHGGGGEDEHEFEATQ